LFSATSGLWAPVFWWLLFGLCALGLLDATLRLFAAEPVDGLISARHHGLTLAWAGLSLLIAARLGVDVYLFVGGGVR
jgi:hypothetical protein